MAGIAPFAGIRYNPETFGTDISPVVAPPYDVLGAEDKEALLNGNPRNIVAIDLPQVPAKKAGPDAVYERSASLLEQWLSDGTMIQDEPSIYVYHQAYQANGRPYVRKKFFAALKLEPFGTGKVFPHEQTFGGPKEDRLKLTKATRCNLSAVFGLFSDDRGTVTETLEPGDAPPDAAATIEGVQSLLWRVSDTETIGKVARTIADEPVYIADGHHRYGTALTYRDWLTEQQGPLPENHPANYVLVGMAAMEDPGLLILPTHRVLENVKGLDLDKLIEASDGALRLLDPKTSDPNVLAEQTARMADGSVGMLLTDRGQSALLVLDKPDVLDRYEPDRSDAYRKLAMSVLHRYIIDELIAQQVNGPISIGYTADADQARQMAEASGGIALITQATRMQQMCDVCQAGDLMPQKSTFFYPKLLTGMVVNPLY